MCDKKVMILLVHKLLKKNNLSKKFDSKTLNTFTMKIDFHDNRSPLLLDVIKFG